MSEFKLKTQLTEEIKSQRNIMYWDGSKHTKKAHGLDLRTMVKT